jgi:general secretion pathway protein G
MLRLLPTTHSPGSKKDRYPSPLGQLGWTLVEMILALAILATLLAIIRPSVHQYVERARVAKAIADIQAIQSDLSGPELLDGQLPATLAEIGWGGMLDPWGAPYQYLRYEGADENQQRKDRFLKPINSTYDLYSKGADGETQKQLTAPVSLDDIVRANDGGFIGLAAKF